DGDGLPVAVCSFANASLLPPDVAEIDMGFGEPGVERERVQKGGFALLQTLQADTDRAQTRMRERFVGRTFKQHPGRGQGRLELVERMLREAQRLPSGDRVRIALRDALRLLFQLGVTALAKQLLELLDFIL